MITSFLLRGFDRRVTLAVLVLAAISAARKPRRSRDGGGAVKAMLIARPPGP